MVRPHNHDIDDDDEFIDLGQDPNDRLLALLDQAIDYRDRDLHNQSREDDGGGRDHICPGISCPFVELNGDSTFVCSVSGRCVGQQHVSSPFTAGITRGIDENGVRTGKQPAVRRASVRSHASMIFASQMAMATARTMIEKNVEMQPLTSTCCDEAATLAEARHANPPKRTRLSKAQGPKALTQEQIEELIRRAEAVLDELVRPAKPDNASCAAKANGKQGGAEKPLLAPESALTSYVRRCRMDGVVPCYNDMHDIVLNLLHKNVVEGRRRSARTQAAERSGRFSNVSRSAAGLVVALWRCACKCPHMRNVKRASDGFRAYAAGVFFSMRRGITLRNGICLIPECSLIADALPAFRSEDRSSPTHAAHVAAHHGVSALHKCISSVAEADMRYVFADAIYAAEVLKKEGGSGLHRHG